MPYAALSPQLLPLAERHLARGVLFAALRTSEPEAFQKRFLSEIRSRAGADLAVWVADGKIVGAPASGVRMEALASYVGALRADIVSEQGACEFLHADEFVFWAPSGDGFIALLRRGADFHEPGSGWIRLAAMLGGVELARLRVYDSAGLTSGGEDASGVVAHLAHELRQPLSAIESGAFYLRMLLPPTEGKARVHLERIQQQVQHAALLVNDAVRCFQPSAPRLELIDLPEALSQELAEAARLEGLQLSVDLAEDLPLVRADLEQLLILLHNAFAYFKRRFLGDGHVQVCCHAAGGFVTIEIGLAPEAPGLRDENGLDELLIFQPARARTSPSWLEMNVMRHIAAAHGGDIQWDTVPGGETRLRILIPADGAEASGNPNPPFAQSAGAPA